MDPTKVGNGGMVDGSAGEKANGKVLRAQTSDQMIVAASTLVKGPRALDRK